ncbi:hypothetical protein HDU91_002013, partial [Kappamyces sp. JEL0680]
MSLSLYSQTLIRTPFLNSLTLKVKNPSIHCQQIQYVEQRVQQKKASDRRKDGTFWTQEEEEQDLHGASMPGREPD